MADPEDIILLNLVRENSQTAFKKIFYKYADSVERFIICYIDDRALAQDFVLDIFTYLWEHRHSLIVENLKAYLFQAARNKSFSYLQEAKKTVPIDDAERFSHACEENEVMEYEELSRFIWEAVSLLPEKCRDIFIKSRAEYMSNKEIAKTLHISEKTVEAQITIAIKKIRTYLSKIYLFF